MEWHQNYGTLYNDTVWLVSIHVTMALYMAHLRPAATHANDTPSTHGTLAPMVSCQQYLHAALLQSVHANAPQDVKPVVCIPACTLLEITTHLAKDACKASSAPGSLPVVQVMLIQYKLPGKR